MHINDRGPTTNDVNIDTGLLLANMFLLGVDLSKENPLGRIEYAKQQWTKLTCKHSQPCPDPPAPPDIIVLHNIHWTLLHMSLDERHPHHNLGKEPILPPAFIEAFMHNLSSIAHSIRSAFPSSLMVMHTAIMPRHDYNTGLSDSKRAFINRIFIDQLNDAHRAVARFLRMPMIDWDSIARGLVPSHSMFDDIHPQDWITWEFYNVALNLLKNWKREESKRARSSDDY